MVVNRVVGASHSTYSLGYCPAAGVQMLETEVAPVTTEPYPGLAIQSATAAAPALHFLLFFLLLHLCVYFWVRGMHAHAAVCLWGMDRY